MLKRTTNHEPRTTNTYAVILVGGKGKRLRPLSTDSRPKAFLSVTRDRKTMFRRTVDRARKIVPPSNIIVVANKRHSRLVRRDIPAIKNENLLLEPVSRNTAPAIIFAASVLKKKAKSPIMVVLPTDQYVIDEEKYLDSIKEGVAFARDDDDALVVLGIKPRFPSTEFGYIRGSWLVARGSYRSICKVEEFVEKPDLDTAKEYVKSEKYLWNAGGFIFTVDAILSAAERLAPRIFNGLKDPDDISANYDKLPDISIDYAIMEKARNIYCVKGDYGWQDMGSFDSLREILRRESREFVERSGKIVKIL